VKRLIFLPILFLIATITLFGQIIDRKVAEFNIQYPEMISSRQLNTRVEQVNAMRRAQGGQPLNMDEKVLLLNEMVAEALIRQAAEKEKVSISETELNGLIQNYKKSAEAQLGVSITDQQFRELVQQQTGLVWEEYVKQLRNQSIQQKYIMQKKQNLLSSVKQPVDKEIELFYRENATRFTNPEIVRFSHVFIDTRALSAQDKPKARERAENIRKEFETGLKTFDQLIVSYTDDVQSRYKGGDFGYIARNDQRAIAILGKPFFDTVFSMAVNQVKGVIESNIGYHIVKVTEHHDPKLLKIDDPIEPNSPTTVRDFIRNGLLQQNQEAAFVQAMQEVIDELTKTGNVVIYKENIQ